MERRFNALEAKVATKADSERVEHAIDVLMKKLDTHDIEQAAIKAQQNRHQRWFKQLAENIMRG
jgi:Trm5-related predicted tRNA methylase